MSRRRDLTAAEFETLFCNHAPRVSTYLRRRTATDAEDLLAETFIIAWQRRRDLPGPDLELAWLYAVARRLLLAQARKQGRIREALGELSNVGALTANETNEDRDLTIQRLLGLLPEIDRELIKLTVWEGLTIAKAAVVVGLRPGTARVRLHRARQRLAAEPEMQALVNLVVDIPATADVVNR